MKIKSIKSVKPRKVYAITTSTGTFIADGLAHHNCPGCNTYRDGEQYKYSLAIDAKYGSGTAKKLYELAKTDFRPNRASLEEVIHDAEEQIRFYQKVDLSSNQ